MNVYKNIYGDTIYEINVESDMLNVKNEDNIILKSKCEIKNDKFPFLAKLDQHYIYTSINIKNIVPCPIDNIFYSVSAVVIVKCDKYQYTVLVQESLKKSSTQVQGGVQLNESFENAMIRELEEETGILKSEIESIEKIESADYNFPFLNSKYQGIHHRFIIYVTLTAERLKEIENHNTDEIIKVHLIRIKNIYKRHIVNRINVKHVSIYYIKKIIKNFKIKDKI